MTPTAVAVPISAGREPAWHAEPGSVVIHALGTDSSLGLAADEATRRLAASGPNAISTGRRVSALSLFIGQFRGVVTWVLLGGAVIAFVVGERLQAVAILMIQLLNAVMAFMQEYRAERAVAALARLNAPHARVVRGGAVMTIPAASIVCGDVLLLEAGDIVAADARLTQATALATAEAALTGESQPVEKNVAPCAGDTPLADRRSCVYLGTSVVRGTARAVVVATGMATELGRIGRLLETAGREKTPLQARIDRVGRGLLWVSLGISTLVVGLGLMRGVPPFELLLTAVSLAVAAVPEGLPAVVTIALALSVQRMARRNAIVRRLPSVETLGCAQVICTDKTGTLTLGAMTARRVATDGAIREISSDARADATPDPAMLDLLRAAAACNDAVLYGTAAEPRIIGDPTEGALLVLAAAAGITRADIDREMPRLGAWPFDSERKRMTVTRLRSGRAWAFVKGAPETVLARCSQVRTATGTAAASARGRDRILEETARMAGDGLRVLAVAERPLHDPNSDATADEMERELTLLGLIGLQDPPRPEARAAVARCTAAGIRTVMITGDHPDTARAIARELGILGAADEVLLGRELQRLTDGELTERVARVSVYARVTAEDKLRIVRAWKARGAVVAMTGDGVNDAPALKEAAIGVAMGRTGTEVTKEAADIVVADDNFASIVAAVEEGRGVYDNIAKSLSYLLAGNAGELALMLGASLAGWPLPLLPAQLLWINFVTDGLPALALASDAVDPDVLRRPPRAPDAQLFDCEAVALTVLTGCLTGATALAAFAWHRSGGDLVGARDAAFTVLVVAELLRAFGARSTVRTVWELGMRSNLPLLGVVIATLILQLAIHHVAVLQPFFGVRPIALADCATWLALGAVPLVVLDLLKVWRRRARAGGSDTSSPWRIDPAGDGTGRRMT
jgi:Ca2+-transporting ATPase